MVERSSPFGGAALDRQPARSRPPFYIFVVVLAPGTGPGLSIPRSGPVEEAQHDLLETTMALFKDNIVTAVRQTDVTFIGTP